MLLRFCETFDSTDDQAKIPFKIDICINCCSTSVLTLEIWTALVVILFKT